MDKNVIYSAQKQHVKYDDEENKEKKRKGKLDCEKSVKTSIIEFVTLKKTFRRIRRSFSPYLKFSFCRI
jgi:hypothetical protein